MAGDVRPDARAVHHAVDARQRVPYYFNYFVDKGTLAAFLGTLG